MIILDPTSILFKNVTPYCIRFAEIQIFLHNRLLFLEEMCGLVGEDISKCEAEWEDQLIESQLRKRFGERLGEGENVIARLFQIAELKGVKG